MVFAHSFCIWLLAVLALPALAQQPAGTLRCQKLVEVGVSATHTERSIVEVPIPVAVVGAKQINAMGSVRLSDVLGAQTGLSIVADHGRGVQSLDPKYTLTLLDRATNLLPESSVAYNAGLQFNPTGKLSIAASHFRNNLRALIKTMPVAQKQNGNLVFNYYNLSQAYNRTLEAEAGSQLLRGLHLSGGYQFFLTETSGGAACGALVARFRSAGQPTTLLIAPGPAAPPEAADDTIDVAGFQAAWRNLQDAHAFFGLLRQFGVSRTRASRLGPPNCCAAWQTTPLSAPGGPLRRRRKKC